MPGTERQSATFGQVLRSARRKAGLTQANLASAAGISASTVQAYEQGKRLPDVRTVERLNAAAGGALEDLDSMRRRAGFGSLPSPFEVRLLKARATPATVWEEVQDVPWVCMVLNERREIVAWNRLANRSADQDLGGLTQFQRSVLRMAATPHFERHLKNWDELIGGHIAILKAEGVDAGEALPAFVQSVLDSIIRDDPKFLQRIFSLFAATEPWPDGKRNVHRVHWVLDDGAQLNFLAAVGDWSSYDGLWAFDWHAADAATASWVSAQLRIPGDESVPPEPRSFADTISNSRHAHGLSRPQLAAQSGAAVSTIAAYENGRRRPTRPAMLALFRALNIDGYSTNRCLREAGFEEEPSDWARYVSGQTPLTIYSGQRPLRPLDVRRFANDADSLPFPSLILDNGCHIMHGNPLARRLVDLPSVSPIGSRPGPHLLQLMVSAQLLECIINWEEVASVFLPGRLEHVVLGGARETSSSSLLALSRALGKSHPEGLERLAAVWTASEGFSGLRRPAVQVRWNTPEGAQLLFNCTASGIDPASPYKSMDFHPADAVTFSWLEGN